MSRVSPNSRPHAVCFPMPVQGHVIPFLTLAKLLHLRGFHITFVNTEFNHKRLLKSRGPTALDGLSDFRFVTIPDGLPPLEDTNTGKDPFSLCFSSQKNFLGPFRELLAGLNDTASSGVPPVSCLVTDGILTCTLTAAEELGIPRVIFWTLAACGFLGYKKYSQLIEQGIIPLKDETYLTNGYLDTVIDWTPGNKNIRLKDLPTLVRSTDLNDPMFQFAYGEIERASKASAIILNTFDALEADVLNSLSSLFPCDVYAIGPLHLQLNSVPEGELKSIGSNFWEEAAECIKWLNTKEPKSVVYVNFGSTVVISHEQLRECAWGLANSKQSFLWIIRYGLVVGESAILPPEFWEEVKDRAFIASWCSQEQVINHASVGMFLTHNGWNSTIESICSGVPMACCPFFADQQINCRYCCTEWGVGMEIDNDVKREEVEKVVRELMEGEKRKEMVRKTLKWKKLAEEAVGPNGSSTLNLDKLVEEVLLSKH
ncbi:7-deoxyloganetin glucosyltransferase [Actinidia chinensis var. chinensis]|uniref:7-deoxyloganetin glucosyltransferase n=1 Tax=Actinidia chinensis var. chinensis TaxID=1590841 RepID=A0A2R6QGW7_ACTCC|nr:7-deoxyloganetin glucosyltransferase [Actinidia chinensis var. chinensis]